MERNREEKIAIFIALFWFIGNLVLYFINDYNKYYVNLDNNSVTKICPELD